MHFQRDALIPLHNVIDAIDFAVSLLIAFIILLRNTVKYIIYSIWSVLISKFVYTLDAHICNAIEFGCVYLLGLIFSRSIHIMDFWFG